MGLLPMNLGDFLQIAEDNDKRIWYFEREYMFELYTVSENVISYTELLKEGLNHERTFHSKPFIGSRPLPASLAVVNNYNFLYLNDQMSGKKVTDVPKHEEEQRENDTVERALPRYHRFF